MAVTSFLYGNVFLKAFNKEINWSGDSIKVLLLSSAYVPNQDTHTYKSDLNVSANEVTGTGYTAGGTALVSKTISYNPTTNQMTLTAANTQWPNSTISARYAVVYDDTPSLDSQKPLLGYIDFGVTEQSSAGTFEIVWNAAGIFQVTVS